MSIEVRHHLLTYFHGSVLDRLREEDWGEEVDKMSQHDLNRLFDLNVVGRAVKLTDKGK